MNPAGSTAQPKAAPTHSRLRGVGRSVLEILVEWRIPLLAQLPTWEPH